MSKNNIGHVFSFKNFFFCVLVLWLICPENRVLKVPKWKHCKMKKHGQCYFLTYVWPQKKFDLIFSKFWPIFRHFPPCLWLFLKKFLSLRHCSGALWTSCLHQTFGHFAFVYLCRWLSKFRDSTADTDTRCTELLSISPFLTGLVTLATRDVGDIRGDSSCQLRLLSLAQVHCCLVSHFYQIFFPSEIKYFSTISKKIFNFLSKRMFKLHYLLAEQI